MKRLLYKKTCYIGVSESVRYNVSTPLVVPVPLQEIDYELVITDIKHNFNIYMISCLTFWPKKKVQQINVFFLSGGDPSPELHLLWHLLGDMFLPPWRVVLPVDDREKVHQLQSHVLMTTERSRTNCSFVAVVSTEGLHSSGSSVGVPTARSCSRSSGT